MVNSAYLYNTTIYQLERSYKKTIHIDQIKYKFTVIPITELGQRY